MEKMNCEQAKQIDLVDYLSSLGHQPQKVGNNDYWYLSPLREEKTASFKVNRRLNVWYDHGTGKGGNFVDFGIQYHKCSIGDLLERLSGYQGRPAITSHLPGPVTVDRPVSSLSAGEKKNDTAGRITIVDVRSLQQNHLLQYLAKRGIDREIADQYCKEVDFLLYEKKHTAVGFQSNSDGFELRNSYFKGSSSPKDITYVDNQKERVSVFEGFFDFMSFKCLYRQHAEPLSSYLILNSLVFLEKSRDIMEKHRHINLYLDANNAGKEATLKALQWDKNKYKDCSKFYHGHEDLNDWYIHQTVRKTQSLVRGRKP